MSILLPALAATPLMDVFHVVYKVVCAPSPMLLNTIRVIPSVHKICGNIIDDTILAVITVVA